MAKIDYGFDDEVLVTTGADQEHLIRPNYRITRSCGNCKYFWYHFAKQRRGFCKLPNPKDKDPKKCFGESFDVERIYAEWHRTHSSCLCDNHVMKPKYYSIGKISEWTEKKFNADGTLKEDD